MLCFIHTIITRKTLEHYPVFPPLFVCQIRTACYGSQLVGGVLSRKAETDVSSQQLGKSLLLFSAQLSHCRTVLRLFDDLSMLAYSHSYGFGAGVSHMKILSSILFLLSSLII